MLGDLPPSSSETRASRSAAVFATALPTAVDPVKAMRSTPGWAASAAPTAPSPVTTFTTPGGKPASSKRCASARVETGVTSEGFTTTVLPAASAGQSFQKRSESGLFQGVMAATTPTGSRTV